MDNYILQTLITQGRIVTSAEIDPDNSYLQVGVYQKGNRKSKAANDAYPAFAIPLSQIASQQVIDVLGNTLYSTNPAAGPNLSSNDNIYLGGFAGENTSGIFRSIFLGSFAGANASSAWISHFIGDSAGQGATNARFSNFIGKNAGIGASNAYYSNFIGPGAGQSATNANYSNFIGSNAGTNSSGNNVIALGTNAAFGNTKSGQFIISPNSLPVYAGLAVATTALSGGASGNRYLWIDSTDNNTVKAYIP